MANSDIILGGGIQRNGARPTKIHVCDNGEYWLCDADVSADGDFGAQDCLAHSSVPMAEGG